MTWSLDAFDSCGDRLDVASARLRSAEMMFEDIAHDWFHDDLPSSLDGLMELLSDARRALSQAVAWLEQSIACLETEGWDDGTGAGGEREGQGEALPDA